MYHCNRMLEGNQMVSTLEMKGAKKGMLQLIPTRTNFNPFCFPFMISNKLNEYPVIVK